MHPMCYNLKGIDENRAIRKFNNRQFATILSKNKTMGRKEMGAVSAPILHAMNKNTKKLTTAALIAALYVVLTHLQNIIFPESTSFAIQFRASEALCVLAFFSPSAVWGLTVGCFLFNITYSASLPLDLIIGSLATLLATGGMYVSRNVKIGGYPWLGMLLPALFNALLVGWELTVYIGGGFWLNALFVAIGEAAVLLVLGTALYYLILRRNLHNRLFF